MAKHPTPPKAAVGEYPKMIYRKDGTKVVVNSPEEEQIWSDLSTPSADPDTPPRRP